MPGEMNHREDISPGISVVVPVFNGQDTLVPLVERLEKVLKEQDAPYQLILVDDGSRDHSWEVIQDICRKFPWVEGVSLMRNYGQHNALLCGICRVRHQVTVTMDDDLQNPPEEIPRLLAKLEEGYDVVYGTPDRPQHGTLRNLTTNLTKLALRVAMGVEAALQVSSFRAFRTYLREAFATYRSPLVSLDVLLTWGTSRFVSVPVSHYPRFRGRSGYTLGRLVAHAFNMMTGYSTLPLQMASVLGFALTLFGVGVLVYVLARYFLVGVVVPGFVFLACLIAILSGAQLFTLGIFGEYLARIHLRSQERPVYVVRESTRSDA